MVDLAGWSRFVLVVALGLSSGCYAELTGGVYRLTEGHEASGKAFSMGLAVGAYIEPNLVHLGAGFGGHKLWTPHEGEYAPSLQVHHHVGLNVRAELKLVDLDPDATQGVWASGSFTWTRSDEIVLIDPGDPNVEDIAHPGWSWAAMLGPSIKAWWGHYGVRLTLGAAVLSTVSDSFGVSRFAGAQARLTMFFFPAWETDSPGTSAMLRAWRHGFDDVVANQPSDQEMRDRNQMRQNAIEDRRHQQQEHFRQNQERQRQRERDNRTIGID